MKTIALVLTAMTLLAAPLSALAVRGAETAAIVEHASHASVGSGEVVAEVSQFAETSGGRVRFIVEHSGAKAPATARIEGEGSDGWSALVVLTPGRNVLFDGAVPSDGLTAELRAVYTTGSDAFDASDCPGVLEIVMKTSFTVTGGSISVGQERCAEQ